MRYFGCSLSLYLVLVFLQGVIFGAMASRNRNTNFRKLPRLKLLRSIVSELDPSAMLLKLRDTKHFPKSKEDRAKIYVNEDTHVPSIECKGERNPIACPTPTTDNKYYCIRMSDLCDKKINCPHGEDEDLVDCMFYNAVKISTDEIHQIIESLYPYEDEEEENDMSYK